MADYLQYWPMLQQLEGLYTVDSGGETYIGISRNAHPEFEGWAIIDAAKEDHLPSNDYTGWKYFGAYLKTLTDLTDQVQVFYKPAYWDPCGADEINNQSIANFIVDWTVNAGLGMLKKVQTVLGVEADGLIGPATLDAINTMDGPALMADLKTVRATFYRSIATKPGLGQYLSTWIARTNSFTYMA
jgi:lysozyme family protein